MADASVTRRELSLGARDSYHGWCGKSFAETTIDAIMYHNGNGPVGLPIGMYARYPHTAFIPDVIHLGDEIKDLNNDYYLVKAVEKMWLLSDFEGYLCNLELIENHYDRPSTSGTWHLDSESLKTDNRYRQKLFLDTYLTAGNIKEDNGSTNAYGVVMFAGVDYPLKLEFVTNTLDYIVAVEKGNVTPLYDAYHYPYCTEETTMLTTYAINKTGITAVNLLDQVYEEIKHAYTDHPVGSKRQITKSQIKREDIGGGCILFSEEVTIKYTRVNDDYTPTYPVVDYGIAFIYEGDRTSGGSEGTWTLTQGAGSTCTQTVTTDKNLYLDQTVFSADSSTVNGTNLALSSTTYGRIRIRYKTSGNATAKVVLGFSSGTQTVLAETASTTFTVVDVAITTAKTINTITLYACDGVGTVTYDFIEIYTGHYTIPSTTLIEPPVIVNDAVMEIPGRVGSVNQSLGSQSMEIVTEHDIDIEPAALSWKKPQTSTATDINNIDTLLELHHRGSFTEGWTWLDLGNPAMQFKARLIEMHPSFSGDLSKIRLVWREYRHGSASGETASERFGVSL